ncbi:MAG: hypothetical protein HZA50_09045 [Planctomycetes bacterium]|nr:hypothetical protein [Planctomycetota bacterium]
MPNMLILNGKDIPLSNAMAHLHDNAEGLLDFPTELRILLCDVPPPPDALVGIVFDIPAEVIAKAGRLRGLLLKVNPDDLGEIRIVLLNKPEPPQSLETFMITSSRKDTIRDFAMTGSAASGTIEYGGDGKSVFTNIPDLAFSATFKAEIVNESAVTADLKGRDALNSPQARLIFRKGEALEKKDFAALASLSTENANRKHEAFLSNPQFQEMITQSGTDMKNSIETITRVVERGDRSVVIFDANSWAVFVRDGKEWKSDD